MGSIYPEKFTFDGQAVRTSIINEIVKHIYLINNELDKNKKGTNSSFLSLSQKVDPQGFEPRQTVPKTGVLPLHHGSALNCECKYNGFFFFHKKRNLFFSIPIQLLQAALNLYRMPHGLFL